MLNSLVEFVSLVAVVAGSLIMDCSRTIQSHSTLCVFLVRFLFVIGIIAVLANGNIIWQVIAPTLKEKVCPIVEAVSSPPSKHTSFQDNRSHSKIRISSSYDMDCYDEAFSDDLSSNDHASESIEWENRTQTTQESADLSAEEALKRSIVDPRVLVGWKIIVEGKEPTAMIMSAVKRKFTTTKYEVRYEDGTTELLKLQRSPQKGNVPFKLLEKAL